MRGNTGFIILFIGIMMIWLALVFIYIQKRSFFSKTNWVQVTARVVYIDEKIGRGRKGGHITMYQPTFQYDWKGFTRTIRTEAWDSTIRYEIGDEVELLIDQDNPSHYRYKNIFQEPVIKMLAGFMFMVLIIFLSKLTANR